MDEPGRRRTARGKHPPQLVLVPPHSAARCGSSYRQPKRCCCAHEVTNYKSAELVLRKAGIDRKKRTGNGLVIRNHLSPRKVQPVVDCEVVLVPLFDVAVPSGEMSGEEAEGGVAVVEADGDSALCGKRERG
jgi:hypothetical protein